MPLRLLSVTTACGELVPAWYSDRDRPWLRDLLRDVEACAGRPVSELVRRWQGGATDVRAGRRLGPARHLVMRALRRQHGRIDLGAVRRELFLAVAAGRPHADALAEVAARRNTTATELQDGLFSDLAGERRVVWPHPLLVPDRLLLALNLAIAQGMLRSAEEADLRLSGASRAVLRTAWLFGAWFTARTWTPEEVRLGWQPNGTHPAAARGLAAVVPVLPWARRFELRARCQVHGEVGRFVLTAQDPILPGPEPREFDSLLERRFARDVLATASGWDVMREPAPIFVGDDIAFPDFLLRHRSTGAAWLVEIAGLRDRAVLPRKLAMLPAVPRLVLCLPDRFVPQSFRKHPRVISFGRRLVAEEVVRRLCRLGAGAGGAATGPP